MKLFLSRTVAGLAVLGIAGLGTAIGAGSAAAMPPGGYPIVHHCATGYTWDGEECAKNTPTPPTTPPAPAKPVNPFGDLNTAMETTTVNSVHLVGWAADPDAATSPISVQVFVDGSLQTTATANVARQDGGGCGNDRRGRK